MWFFKNQEEKKDRVKGIVAVAIDNDRESQNACKWAIDHLLAEGSTLVLTHVITPKTEGGSVGGESTSVVSIDLRAKILSMFLPYRVYCTLKNIPCKDVILEDVDISKALIEYASHTTIEHLVLGTKTGLLRRFKTADIPRSVAEGAPDSCTVYAIANGKIQSMKSASCPAPPPNMRGCERLSMEALGKQVNVRPAFLRRGMTINNEWDVIWREENGCTKVKLVVSEV